MGCIDSKTVRRNDDKPEPEIATAAVDKSSPVANGGGETRQRLKDAPASSKSSAAAVHFEQAQQQQQQQQEESCDRDASRDRQRRRLRSPPPPPVLVALDDEDDDEMQAEAPGNVRSTGGDHREVDIDNDVDRVSADKINVGDDDEQKWPGSDGEDEVVSEEETRRRDRQSRDIGQDGDSPAPEPTSNRMPGDRGESASAEADPATSPPRSADNKRGSPVDQQGSATTGTRRPSPSPHQSLPDVVLQMTNISSSSAFNSTTSNNSNTNNSNAAGSTPTSQDDSDGEQSAAVPPSSTTAVTVTVTAVDDVQTTDGSPKSSVVRLTKTGNDDVSDRNQSPIIKPTAEKKTPNDKLPMKVRLGITQRRGLMEGDDCARFRVF